MSDATGSSAYVYDPFSELTSAQNGAGQTVSYGYDYDGDVTGITYPLPGTHSWATTTTVGYGYDHADIRTSVTDFNNQQIAITPNADGLPNSVTLGSTGDTISASYDNTDTPSAITLQNSNTTLQSFTYSDSPAGTILSETDTPSSAQSPADYAYDAQGRVTSDTPGTGSAKSYSFDASSSLTTLPTGATGTYDHAGELTSSALSGTTTSYTYNAVGQRLTATQGSTTVASATWNGAAEPTAYSNSAASMSTATYDGDGIRTSTTITPSGQPATTQQYVWDTRASLPEMLIDSSNAYVFENGAAPIEQVNLSTGAVTYLVTDSLGSVRGAVSSSGTLSGMTSYDAWGNPQTTGGLTATTPFGFAGGYSDADGLVYLLARYYDPSAGQFLSVDPMVSQTLQPYEYADGNPVTNTDPSGRLVRSCGTSVGWLGVSVHCTLYWGRFETRVLAADVSSWGVAAAAIADVVLCQNLPIPALAKSACFGYLAVYEFWTIHEINTANALNGCFNFTVGVKVGFGIAFTTASPGAVSKSNKSCKS